MIGGLRSHQRRSRKGRRQRRCIRGSGAQSHRRLLQDTTESAHSTPCLTGLTPKDGAEAYGVMMASARLWEPTPCPGTCTNCHRTKPEVVYVLTVLQVTSANLEQSSRAVSRQVSSPEMFTCHFQSLSCPFGENHTCLLSSCRYCTWILHCSSKLHSVCAAV